MDNINDLKVSYTCQLRPFLEMLEHKKLVMNDENWLSLVKKTKQSIIKSPSEFLRISRNQGILELAVTRVFAEFLDEMARQSRPYRKN